jgi:serine/threonine protein kinase
MSQPDEEDDQDFSCIHKHYDFGPILGEGNFSSVNLCQHRITRESVAIKVLEKNRIKNHEDLERIGREIRIMRKVRHPHIIQFYEIQESKEHLYFVMEYANGGELYEHIVKNKRLLEPEACHIFHQLLQAIEYTHNLGIAHRDIKPENILLDSNHDIKFIDFGLGQTYSSDELLSTACGSPCYAAPEMVARKKYNGMKVDIWSSGITLYAMLCGYLPFDDEDLTNLYSKILKGEFVIPNHISKEAGDLIKKILVTDPTKRISLEEIKQHSWLKIRLLFRIPRKPFSLATMTEIDEEILMLVSGYGFEYNEVRDAVENNYLSPLTTTYYLLLRKKVLGNFDDIDLEILEKQKKLTVTGSPSEKFAESESTHGRRLKTEGNCEYEVTGECEESDRFDLEKLSDGTAEHSLNYEQNLRTEDISNQINSNTSEAINFKEPESSKYQPKTEKDPRSVKVSYPNVNNSKNSFSNQGSGSNQGIDNDNLRISTSDKNDYLNRGTTAEELKKLITSEKLETPKESSIKNLGKAYYYKCSGKEGTKTVQEKPNSNSNFHVHQNINQQYHNNNFIIQNPNYKFTNPVIIHHQHNLTEGQGSEIIQEYSNSGQVMDNRFADSDGSKILEKGYPGQKSQSQSQTHSNPQAQALSIAQSHAQSLAQVQSINYDRNSQLQVTNDKKRLVKKSITSNRYQNLFPLKKF